MILRDLAGEKVSQLGFGAMRLPLAGGKVDIPEATRMIHRAVEGGINYFDTAWVYHGGESEGILGKALAGSRRDKVFIATKSPVWEIKAVADWERILDAQLARLGTDRIDFYLLHALNAHSWADCQRLDALAFLERAKRSGKIRHYGFSFHDRPEVFPAILNAHNWEFCQVQFNYLDRGPAQGHPGLDDARKQGTDVIIMEPLRGGNLAGRMPDPIARLWAESDRDWSPAEWALRWIWNHRPIATVLSGMSSMAQLEENLRVAGAARVDGLDAAAQALVDRVSETFRGLIAVPCTACRYCMPCPHGVDIPRNFGSYNEHFMFAGNPAVKAGYQWIPADQRAAQCQDCGICSPLCPQRIDIPARLREVAATFA